MKTVNIGSRRIGTGDLFFVIEEGQANLGDFEKALSMIDYAADAGGDAIEFQLARADDFYVKNQPGYEIYSKREFSETQLIEIVSKVKEKGMEMIAVPLSHRLVNPLVKAGCSAFNINASDLTNPDIIDAVIDSGLPFFLSLPLATEEEIDWAVRRIRKNGDDNFMLLHGQHTMASGEKGVNIEHTSLGYITTLKEKYQVPVGFIDHTPLKWMPACAVAAGADTISKHLTWSREERGPDWHICLEPDEMKEAIIWAYKMNQSIKTKNRQLAPGENLDRSIMRRSIVASRAIKSGKSIERNDICFKRPGDGIDPAQYNDLIGKVARRDILPDEQITTFDLEDD